MSAKGFTPRPWSIGAANRRDKAVVGIHGQGAYGYVICDMQTDGYDEDTQGANARLIASAPTLLEALALAASKPLAQHCTDEEWEFIRSAILGAQGEQP